MIHLSSSTNHSLGRDGEAEARSPARLRFGPDAAAVSLDDLLAGRQADAGAGVRVPIVQSLEDDEDSLRVLGVDADAVVADGEDPLPACRSAETWIRGAAVPRNLIAFSIRFWNSRSIREASADSVGRGSWVTTAPVSSIACFRSTRARSRTASQSVG